MHLIQATNTGLQIAPAHALTKLHEPPPLDLFTVGRFKTTTVSRTSELKLRRFLQNADFFTRCGVQYDLGDGRHRIWKKLLYQ